MEDNLLQVTIQYVNNSSEPGSHRFADTFLMKDLDSFTVDDKGVTVSGKSGTMRYKRFIPMHNIQEIHYEYAN